MNDAKITALLDCLAANHAVNCDMRNVHMNLDTPTVEFDAVEMHIFHIVLRVTDDLKIVETCDDDTYTYADAAAYVASLNETFA